MQRQIKLDRRKSASTVRVEIGNEVEISLHVDTIRNQTHETGLLGRVACKRPYVNKINSGKRLKFTKEALHKPLNFWKSVICSDESKFRLFGSDGNFMVWRTPREEFDLKYTVSTFKHDGDSVTVWGCFTGRWVGKLCILDRIMDYCDIFLE